MIATWSISLLAAQVGSQIDPIQLLLNNGIMGLFWVLLLFTNKLHTGALVDELREQNAKKDEVIRILSSATQHTIPAMQRNAEVLEAIPDREAATIEQLAALVDQLKEVVAREQP